MLYRVYRDGVKVDTVEADNVDCQDGCLTLSRYERHVASAACGCPEWQRMDDSEPREPCNHTYRLVVAVYAPDRWRRVEVEQSPSGALKE